MFIGTQRIEQKTVLEEGINLASMLPMGMEDSGVEEFQLKVSKPQQYARASADEEIGMECVQAYISNMSAPTSLAELAEFGDKTLPENLMSSSENEWTAPRWAKAGDIVFFMHAKTARSSLTALRSELKCKKNTIDKESFTLLEKYIQHALDVHTKYGGKIFAVGRVCGAPEYVDGEELSNSILHWKSKNYSAIDNIVVLERPLDISEFNSYIEVSRGSATTPLFNDEFDRLRNVIGENNSLPRYVMNSVARPIPLRKINDKNWLEVANDYRRCFILEKQFRAFYVDYLIRAVGDQKKYFEECRCCRDDINDSFMDYVMLIDGKYLPVETKLSVAAEADIKGQVAKYVNNSAVYLTNDRSRMITWRDFHPGKVLVIDTEKVYIFNAVKDIIYEIMDLRSLTDFEQLRQLRDKIVENLR